MQLTIEIEVQDCDGSDISVTNQCENLTLEIIDAPVSDSVSIDDSAGAGDTDVTWSADKSARELAGKVDKVEGYSLVADEEIDKLSTVEQYAQKNTVNSVAGKQGDVLLDKEDVGLSAVDNTSDADKPVSAAVAAALSDKVDAEAGMGLSELSFTTVDKLSLDQSEQDRHTHNNKPVIDGLSDDAGVLQYKGLPISDQAALDAKVDKVAGYSLVDDAEIAKLVTVQENATANRDDALNADKVHDHTVSQVVGLSDRLDSIDSLIGDVEAVLIAINGEP